GPPLHRLRTDARARCPNRANHSRPDWRALGRARGRCGPARGGRRRRRRRRSPGTYALGERAHREVLSIAFAGAGQHQDAGAKIIHAAPNTTSNIFAKSISKDGGRGSYRGLLEIANGAHGSKSKVVCDALLLDEHSRSDTYPTIRIGDDNINVAHEATVSKVGDEQLFYLM